MAKFISGEELNFELGKIIDDAQEQLIIISPYIKLHDRIRDRLRNQFENYSLEVTVLFGKNEKNILNGIYEDDLTFLKRFPDIEIRYEKRLHAKYYANDNSAILTSMNLYDFSMDHNIEFGIKTESGILKNIVGGLGGNSLDANAFNYFSELIYKSELYFKREPIFEEGWFGLNEKYINSEIRVDLFNKDFVSSKDFVDPKSKRIGYCIRTGVEIPFNPKKPFSLEAFKEWVKFKNPNYKEKYCHFSGEISNGETSFSKPILMDNLKKITFN